MANQELKVGVFPSKERADKAANELRKAGLSRDDIHLATHENRPEPADEDVTLEDLGMSENEVSNYEKLIDSGQYVLVVRADDNADQVAAIIAENGGRDAAMGQSSMMGQGPGMGSMMGSGMGSQGHDEGARRMEIVEEELKIRKEPQSAGEVRVRKEVVTEHRTMDVPVEREEVIVERRPVGARPPSGDSAPDDEVRIPVREERVRVEKEPVVREEVVVKSRKVPETQQVSGDVRREQLRVEDQGAARHREAKGGSSEGGGEGGGGQQRNA
jgi:uncharacterized protein (TIGR02271 family)